MILFLTFKSYILKLIEKVSYNPISGISEKKAKRFLAQQKKQEEEEEKKRKKEVH
jgi:hypothetical protein